MTIVKDVVLSPGHGVIPNLIAATPEGDFIVAGSNGLAAYRAWAMRVDSEGRVLWEYLEGGSDKWNDFFPRGERFSSALALPERETLLCALKRVDGKPSAYTYRLDAAGSPIEVSAHRPANGLDPSRVRCERWGDGYAMLGSLVNQPQGTGWLAKFDVKGRLEWEKVGDAYSISDFAPLPSGDFALLVMPGDGANLYRVNPQGEVVTSTKLKGGWQFVHNLASSRNHLLLHTLESGALQIVDYSETLKMKVIASHLSNVGDGKAWESPAGTVVVFGGKFWRQQATASINVVKKSGEQRMILLDPVYSAPRFFDAAPTSVANVYATTRIVNNIPAHLTWIHVE